MPAPLTRAELLALPAVIDIPTAARALGIGRTKAYELAQEGRFPCAVLRIDNRYRVLSSEVLRLLRVGDDEPRRPASDRRTA